jgi:hypothetical protein
MGSAKDFKLHTIQISVRFIQGYRYLDRCGECMIRLEEALDKNWIPTETSPTSGTMKNDFMGMRLTFNSEGLTIRQSEYLEVESFKDQSCTTYDVLWRALEVGRVTTPALLLSYQKGFEENEEDQAEQYLLKMGLCETNQDLLGAIGGQHAALQLTIVTQQDATQNDPRVAVRRRLQANVVRQIKQQNYETRFLQRARALGSRQGDAIRAMRQMKSHQPDLSPVAVQLELEASLDGELSASKFDMSRFIVDSVAWADRAKDSLVKLRRS